MKILLTNDDSHRSPLLRWIMRELRTRGDVTVVVPKHEQSWKGKSMTRFGYLHLEEMQIDGHKVYTLDGTPADCINVGIYHVCDPKPDLVVSGINAGQNSGTGFIFSSGTVGAGLEANIAGIPAIALSQMFDTDTMSLYVADYALPEATASRLEQQLDVLLKRLFSAFLSGPEILREPITWNVNFPFDVTEQTEFRLCSVGHTTYGSHYRRDDQRFVHNLLNVTRDGRPECDANVLLAGHVSISPLDMKTFGQVEDRTLGDFIGAI